MKVLKFSAIWCSACLIMKPRMAEIEKELPWLETISYDYDMDQPAVRQWKIDKLLPTLIFVDCQNKEIERIHGEQSKKKLLSLIEKYRAL